MTLLSRLAATAPAPVFAAIGPDVLPAVERLCLRPAIRLARTPRDAAILLVAGSPPDDTLEALDRLHDQLPPGRVTVDWDGVSEIEPVLLDRWRAVLAGEGGEADRRPDTPPNPWEGEGDHGQGGEGMMGGTPYGRPMAMTGEDVRDGLQLDRYSVRVGPFVPMLPPGLTLDVTLQGDVIVDCHVTRAPFAQPAEADAPGLCAARMLRLLGLDAAARRVIDGRKPRAAWIAGALPAGLGDAGGARGRLAAWLEGQTVTDDATGIFDTLIGLEWSEATLLLSSFPPSALAAAAKREEPA